MKTVENLQDIGTSSEQIQHKEDYSNETLTNELIEGTPLWCIKNNEDGTAWTLAFGKYALKQGKSKEELKKYLEENMLIVITNMMIAIIEESKSVDNEKLENEKQSINNNQ